jgi:hypothetical protein
LKFSDVPNDLVENISDDDDTFIITFDFPPSVFGIFLFVLSLFQDFVDDSMIVYGTPDMDRFSILFAQILFGLFPELRAVGSE